jgi:NitT/TauT family transport system substrate-binding protein
MSAAEQGAKPLGFYPIMQQGIYSLVTTPNAGVRSVDDLKGATIGVRALDSGGATVARAMLASAGLKEGEGYKLLAVGDGGPAAIALKKGDIKAYLAAFLDVLIMKNTADVVDISPSGEWHNPDSIYVLSRETQQKQPDLIPRLGRALAKGAAYVAEHPDETLDITCEAIPEECKDRDFAKRALDAVRKLMTLPPEANGQWGYVNTEALQAFGDMLADQGVLHQKPDASAIFTNEFVEEFNAK